MPDGRDEVLALLALGKAEGIGPERLHRLVAYFATAQAVLEAADWEAVIQGPPAYRRPGRAEFEWARSQWSRLKAEGGRCYVAGDGDYPELLHQIPSPPPLLFAWSAEWPMGSMEPHMRPRCGLVGAPSQRWVVGLTCPIPAPTRRSIAEYVSTGRLCPNSRGVLNPTKGHFHNATESSAV